MSGFRAMIRSSATPYRRANAHRVSPRTTVCHTAPCPPSSGLAPVPAGLITLAFALVLYLAALQAQGVRAREVLRLDW